MSDLTQLGQHPDADQLTAFVEHALPPHEREQTLAHLATCAGCRAIVTLSLPPLEESLAPQPNLGAPQPALSLPKGLDSETWDGEPKPSRRPWFKTWHLTWPTAAAFAALAFVIIHLHNTAPTRSAATPSTEIAASKPPAPLYIPPPAPASTRQLVLPPPAARPGPPNQIAAGSAKTKSPTTLKGESAPNLPVANRSYTAYVTPPPAAATGTNQQATGNAAPAAPQIQPASTVPRPQPNTIIAGAAPAMAPPPTTRAGVAASPQAATTAAAGLQANSSPLSSIVNINGYNVDPNTAPNRGSIQPLPSRLPAISTARNGHQVLAIDAQNALFFSEDDGRNWTPIPTQWQGRAVRVNLARPTMSLTQNAAITATPSTLGVIGGTVPSPTPTSVTGTITDATGAAIPNTSVTITNPTTQTARTATSDRNGHYLIDNLTPGTYQLEATAPGFKKQQLAINIAASQQNLANLTLAVGAASETVTVEASAQNVPLAAPRTASRKSAPPAPAKPIATPLFEITTDNGDHWTSPDGKTWKQK